MARTITTHAAYTDILMSRNRNDLGKANPSQPAGLSPNANVRIGDAAVPGDPILQYVFGFEFPVLSKGTYVSTADLSIQFTGINQTDGRIDHNADLWITGHNTDLSNAAPWYLGSADGVAPGGAGPDGTNLVQAGFLTPQSTPGVVHPNSAGAEVLMNSVNAFMAAVYNQDQPYAGGHFLCLRLNCNKLPVGGNATTGYQLDASEGARPPMLTLTID